VFKILKGLVLAIRPRQSLKNLSLFAALVFTGWLFEIEKFSLVLRAFFCFTILTSAVYILNDIVDIEVDKLHPDKRRRAIASGVLPLPLAIFFVIFGVFVSLFWAQTLSFFFFLACFVYLFLQVLYSFFLKNVAILDVLIIASGFILRVYSGAFVIDAHLNVWFLLCVISFSLFLAVGKRRAELTLIKAQGLPILRKTLKEYPELLLNLYISVFATATFLSYAFFTFLEPPVRPERHIFINILAILPRALTAQKLLMATIPLVVYGIMRYLLLIYKGEKGESPEKILLSDVSLLLTVISWGIMVVGIIYIVG